MTCHLKRPEISPRAANPGNTDTKQSCKDKNANCDARHSTTRKTTGVGSICTCQAGSAQYRKLIHEQRKERTC
eukprot:scaffold160392_cov18-Tisochrysis_lutea.AAC.3